MKILVFLCKNGYPFELLRGMSMNKDVKGFAADIDRTLTNKGSGLPQINKDALEILHAHGMPLGLATGRVMVDALKEQGKTWGLSFEFDYLICMNGGQVYDAHTGRLFEKEVLSQKDMRIIFDALLDVINEYKIEVNCEGCGNEYAMNVGPWLSEAAARHGWAFTDATNDVDTFCSKPAFKMLFRTDPNSSDILLKRFNETLKGKYYMCSSFPGTLEIMNLGINKGSGVDIYASWYDMSIKDFICFGDNENDEPMLEAAGWSVALANAWDHTKSLCHDVTELDCENGGVGDYLFKHLIIPRGWDK